MDTEAAIHVISKTLRIIQGALEVIEQKIDDERAARERDCAGLSNAIERLNRVKADY